MPEHQLKPVEQRVKSFASRLKRDYGQEIRKDPSRFKARVIGTLKAVLPRNRPGRNANPEIVRAMQIYQELTVQWKKGKDGIWHQVALRACPAPNPILASRGGSFGET
jgi:hypothetical protein